MKSHNRMIDRLPPYERENKIINAIYDVLGAELDKSLYEIEDLYKQFNIDTATWGLAAWEKNLKLTGGSGLTLRQRRARIKTKLRGSAKVDIELLKTMIQDYYDNEVYVDFDGIIRFNLPLEGYSFQHNERVENIIKNTRPAHLGYEIDYYTRYVEADTFFGMATHSGEIITVYPNE